MSWIKITEASQIPLREGRCVQVGRREIAIFHLPDRFLAIDNLCPHNQGPLCDGIVKGTTVVCPLHGWNVNLETGRVTQPDVPVGVTTYPARVKDGIIEIEWIKAEAAAAGEAA
jgi:nitrite reductase (NADH) small subunit